MGEVAIIAPDVPAERDRTGWADAIGGAWRKSVEAIFETGRLIAEAKAALPHGEFGTMIETELPFGARTAERLMAIAADPKLTNPTHVSVLPASWGTLYELTKLDEDTFKRRVSEGAIRPDMQRRDVATGGARSIMASREQPAESLDFFPTPPWATRALVEVVLPHLGVSLDGMTVHDPACGEGHMTGVLLEYEKIGAVVGSDIKDYGRDGRSVPAFQCIDDFLEPKAGIDPDWIVTNPPFGEKTLQFVLRALDVAGTGVAMFVRQQWLEGVDRYEELFRDQPPTLYAQFVERVNLCEGRWDPYGSTATAYCWLVWVRDRLPQAPFWIPPGQRKRFFYADDVERFTAHPVLAPEGADPLLSELMAMATEDEPEPAEAVPATVTADEFAEYKAMSAISAGVGVAGPLVDRLRSEGLVWPNDLVLTPAGAQRAQFLHELVQAATDEEYLDAVRIEKTGSLTGRRANLIVPDEVGAYEAALEKLADRKGKLVMAEAATALRFGRETGITPQRLAEDLGHPIGTIKTWLNRLGLTDMAHMEAMNAERKAVAEAARVGK